MYHADHAPVLTSQSIYSIAESFDLDIHTGQMCSEFLSLSSFSVCIIFTEVWGMFTSFLEMKNGGRQSALLLYGCTEMGVVLRLWAFISLCCYI